MLTAKQWIFLERFAVGHGTTLAEIAQHVVKANRPISRTAPGKGRFGVGIDAIRAPKQDAKLVRDQQRAADAIGIMERYLAKNVPEHPALRESVDLELKRIRRAYSDPALLWSIYRRADKGTGYAVAPIQKRKAA